MDNNNKPQKHYRKRHYHNRGKKPAQSNSVSPSEEMINAASEIEVQPEKKNDDPADVNENNSHQRNRRNNNRNHRNVNKHY